MEQAMNFLLVLVTAVAIAGSVGTLYASGLRLWAEGIVDDKGHAELLPRIGSVICFGGCVVIVLFALYLIIPAFH
jgi:hypothetical protein